MLVGLGHFRSLRRAPRPLGNRNDFPLFPGAGEISPPEDGAGTPPGFPSLRRESLEFSADSCLPGCPWGAPSVHKKAPWRGRLSLRSRVSQAVEGEAGTAIENNDARFHTGLEADTARVAAVMGF